jgi:3-methyladenine DNA glycosylase/8-oxoguanine DNA glycosylase
MLDRSYHVATQDYDRDLINADLALRKVVSSFYGDGGPLTTPEVREIGARFEPFQNLSAHYLLLRNRLPG